MADTTFVNYSTAIDAAWLNEQNDFVHTLFGGPAVTSQVFTITGLDVALAGNLTLAGTVDGRDVAADGTKLDGIEAGATADQSAAEIKTAYESNADTNAFTDAEQTKLSGIETGATADQTAAEIEAIVSHDNLLDFVANEHINHTSVTLTAGSGLSGGGDISASRSFAVDINGLTADGSPDTAADYVMTYDASAAGLKKVLLSNLGGGGDPAGGSIYFDNECTTTTTTSHADVNDPGDNDTAEFQVWVPTGKTTLNYSLRIKKTGGGTGGQFRLKHSAHNGTDAATNSTTYEYQTGTLDVTDEAGGWLTVTLQGYINAITTSIECKVISWYFS